jgi:hypothetical protein
LLFPALAILSGISVLLGFLGFSDEGRVVVGAILVTAGVAAMPSMDQEIGVIKPDELYTLKAFVRRLGIRAATLRSARRAGLNVYYVHKHAYVYGRHWIDYVTNSDKGDSRATASLAG